MHTYNNWNVFWPCFFAYNKFYHHTQQRPSMIHHIFFTEWFFYSNRSKQKLWPDRKAVRSFAQSSHFLKSKVARKGMKIFRCCCTFRRKKPNYKGYKCLCHDSAERHFLDISWKIIPKKSRKCNLASKCQKNCANFPKCVLLLYFLKAFFCKA